MKMKIKVKFIPFLLVAMFIVSCSSYRSVGDRIDDSILVPSISSELTKTNSAFADANNRVVVSSYSGVVLLTGQVANQGLKNQAAQVALSIVGVKSLHNYLEVGSVVSKSTKVSDSLITTKVKSRFWADSRLRANGIKVITENGSVYLMGKVTRQDSDLALKTARMIDDDIRQVVILFDLL